SVRVAKDSRRIAVSISVGPIYNEFGEAIGISSISRDITAQKHVERELQVREERFRTAFEMAPFGMCLSVADRRLVLANVTLCRMLGYSEEELKTLSWDRISHPDDMAHSYRAIEKLTLDPATPVSFEKRYVHKDGWIVWARVRVAIVNELGGSWHYITH